MTKVATFARTIAADPAEGLRTAIVLGCATALILAGQAFPLI